MEANETAGPMVVVTAVRPETRAVLAALRQMRRRRPAPVPTWDGVLGGRPIVVMQVGVGPAAVERALSHLPVRMHALVSAGFAGALCDGIDPGTIVAADLVVWEEAGALLAHRLPEALIAVLHDAAGSLPTVRGTLLSSPDVLTSAMLKRAAGIRANAVAVEMEARVLVEYAAAAAVPFAPLRVVLDPASLSLEGLPPDLDRSWRARMRVVSAPASWGLLATVARHALQAARALTALSAHALPAVVALPPFAPARIVPRLTDR